MTTAARPEPQTGRSTVTDAGGNGPDRERPEEAEQHAVPPLRQADLSYVSAVDRSLVHRASIAEVFVTDSCRVDEEHFLIGAQLPRGHSMRDTAQHYDFNLLVEVLRQAGVLVAHQHLDVPLDTAFAFRSLDISVRDMDCTRIGAQPATGVVDTTVRVHRNASGRPTSMTFTGTLHLDGRAAVSGTGSLVLLSEHAWETIRRRGRRQALETAPPRMLPTIAAEAAAVGRRNAANVVISRLRTLSGERAEARLLVDVAHPFMFDHPLDHVPGNLLLEAARQLSIGALAARHHLDPFALLTAACTVSFDGFVELDLPTRLVAAASDLTASDHGVKGTVSVSLEQADRTAASCSIVLEVLG